MTLRERFEEGLRGAMLAGEPYSSDLVDQVLNDVTDGAFADEETTPDFAGLFDLARDYHVHDRAVRSLQPRRSGNELVAYRGAGESAGGALVAASSRQGPQAQGHLAAVRRRLTEACLEAGEGSPERAEALAWLSGFHAALG